MTPTAAPSLKLRVTQKVESILRAGHPWLFSDSVRDQSRPGAVGELAIIYDRKDQFLGMGLFDPDGPIRVRMLHAGKPQKVDHAWWQHHLAVALDRRRNLFDAQTNGYRLCNGESDGWPGLVLDRYDTTLVLKIYTTVWLSRLNDIVALIGDQVPHERLILRLSRNIQDKAVPFFEGQILRGPPLVETDAFDWLNSTAAAPQSFDLIVLDPPSLARRESERAQAIRAYGRLARSAIELLAPKGILVACSCSAHVSAPEFLESVRAAAIQSGRRFTELRTTGHAADHPATFPEANYLKAIYLGF